MQALRLGLAFYAQFLKGMLAFRWDFMLNLAGLVVGQVMNVIMLTAIFQRIPHLQGWHFEQVLLIFGFSQMALSLFYVVGSSLNGVNHLILDGTLDQFLLRPINPLFQILAQELGMQQISGVITSLAIIAYAANRLHIVANWWQLPVFVVLALGATGIYFGVALIGASLSFWYPERSGFVWPIMTVADVTAYPITIYPRPVQFLVTWVLPFAFATFYPATLIMGLKSYSLYAWLTPIVGLAFTLIGYRVWQRGLQVYGSTGS